MTFKRLSLHTSLTLALLPFAFAAQAQNAKPSDCSKLPTHTEQGACAEAHAETKTIFLKNIANQYDANELMVAIRNSFDPNVKIILVTNQNALVITTYPEEFARIEALVRTLDIPHKAYRLTYTITELDAGKPIGTEHIAMVAVDGQRTTVKQGDKIPVATGSYSTDNNSQQTQFTYLDIGLNFDATLSALENGAMLKTKVEQSSLGQPSTIAGVTEPVVRQTVLEGNTFLTLGKPVVIGSIDVPNSTHRFDLAVVMDAIK
jgi:type II secretory pathway component GspD/PulD (secretin)